MEPRALGAGGALCLGGGLGLGGLQGSSLGMNDPAISAAVHLLYRDREHAGWRGPSYVDEWERGAIAYAMEFQEEAPTPRGYCAASRECTAQSLRGDGGFYEACLLGCPRTQNRSPKEYAPRRCGNWTAVEACPASTRRGAWLHLPGAGAVGLGLCRGRTVRSIDDRDDDDRRTAVQRLL